MFILYTDGLTGRVIGYNKVVDDEVVDNITTFLMPDDMVVDIKDCGKDFIYYEDGKIIRKECKEDSDFLSAVN